MKCEKCGSGKHFVKECIEASKMVEVKKPADVNIFFSILNNVFGFPKI
jgi:hypothetical protein